MKTHKIYLLGLVVFFYCCNSAKEKKDSGKLIESDISYAHCPSREVIKNYNDDERNALDFISKNNIGFINDSCIKYMYVIYGRNSVYDTCLKIELTIGESVIRLINATQKNDTLLSLYYGYFVNDSLPISARFDTSVAMINGFNLNLKTAKLLNANIGEAGYMMINDVMSWYTKTLNSKDFKEYLDKNYYYLNSKFIQLLGK